MATLELNLEETEFVQTVLSEQLKTIRIEISNSDSIEYRRRLTGHEKTLVELLDRLRATGDEPPRMVS